MRGARPRIALVLVALGIGIVAAACASGAEPRTGIAGSVRDWGAFGGTVPARDVDVFCLDAATGKTVASTRTDGNGKFFISVPAGRYQVDYASGSRPAPVAVDVAGGEVATVEPFVGRRGGPQASPPEERLKAIIRREALALGVKKKTAVLWVSGTTVGAAARLFGGSSDLPAKTRVWVCVLTGDVWGSSSQAAARDLSRGGFVVFKRERDARGLCAGRWTEWGVNGVVEAMR